MSENEEIDALEKRIDLLNAELQKTNLIGNKNLPIIIKTVFIFIFFTIMGFLRPELVEKIFEIFAIKMIGIMQ